MKTYGIELIRENRERRFTYLRISKDGRIVFDYWQDGWCWVYTKMSMVIKEAMASAGIKIDLPKKYHWLLNLVGHLPIHIVLFETIMLYIKLKKHQVVMINGDRLTPRWIVIKK